ncbi:ABC transporter ATP-binding protein [Polystyrenella longa]|uniref:ABC transporter ATP-binding protein n=1 Tax=Polystyrenella longa TaxID=2528007 RepID=UPI0011A52571|nr:ABC transporter ATP-binding protein [Polystyrenella longa]
MNNFARALPYLWPFRKRLFLSILFAVLVAILWGTNLTAIYPVVKVMLENKDLVVYADEQIAAATEESDALSKKVNDLTERRAEFEAQLTNENLSKKQYEQLEHEKDRLIGQLSDKQTSLSKATSELSLWTWVKSDIIEHLPRDKFDVLAVLLAALLIATIIKGIFVVIQETLISSVVELTTINLRKECFKKVLSLDYQTVHHHGTGDLLSRFTNDLNLFGLGLRLAGGKIIREPLKAIACMGIAFMVNWRLTLLSLLMGPLIAIVFNRIGKRLKHASHRMMESMSRIYQTLEETFDNLKVVIAFNGAPTHRRRFHRENKEYYNKMLRIIKLDALTSPTTETLGMIAGFMAVLPGTYLVLRGTTEIWGIQLAAEPMTIASLIVLYAMLAGIIDPIRKLSTTYSKLRRSSAAADRIFELLDTETLVKEPETPLSFPRHSQSISFRRIEFDYFCGAQEKKREQQILSGVDLDVNAGEVIVVVGENGSGKSTLVNLLPRYYDPDYGTVEIDGINIRDVKLKDLRAQIGVVTQETLLFDNTIYDNIRYGKPEANSEEIIEAARQANVLDFSEQLPDGLQTWVGEKGGRLSGGQRQRIALARAFLSDPSILILDEATSAIDAQSEILIHEALRQFSVNRTVFLITHSVSPGILDFVSRIAVMDQGQLVAVGPHDTLILSCPVYQKLYQAQTHQRSSRTGPIQTVHTDDFERLSPSAEEQDYMAEVEDQEAAATGDSSPSILKLDRSTNSNPTSPNTQPKRKDATG